MWTSKKLEVNTMWLKIFVILNIYNTTSSGVTEIQNGSNYYILLTEFFMNDNNRHDLDQRLYNLVCNSIYRSVKRTEAH